jgi:hypothetical protein
VDDLEKHHKFEKNKNILFIYFILKIKINKFIFEYLKTCNKIIPEILINHV